MPKDIDKAIKSFESSGLSEQFPEEYAKLLALRETDFVADHKEAEFVLLYLTLPDPGKANKVECKWCNLEFITNYAYQRYCSTECLKAALLDRGLEWNPDKPLEERWHGEPPAAIKPATLTVLHKWAEQVVAYETDSSQRPQEPSELDLKFAALFG